MGDAKAAPARPADERRPGLELMKRLLATLEEWGAAQGRTDVTRLREVTLEALLRTVTAICVYHELAAAGGRADEVRAQFQRINKDGPVAEEDESLLRLRARRDLLLRSLEQAVRAF